MSGKARKTSSNLIWEIPEPIVYPGFKKKTFKYNAI
jgi:hypothetical protein